MFYKLYTHEYFRNRKGSSIDYRIYKFCTISFMIMTLDLVILAYVSHRNIRIEQNIYVVDSD